MDDINAVISCVKVVLTPDEAQEMTDGKRKHKRKAIPAAYRVVFNTGLEVCFSYDEVYEYHFYEEAALRHTFEEMMINILFRRMLTAVLPYVVFTKRTQQQVRSRVSELCCGAEPVWEQMREAAADRLMDYLISQQYVDDERYTRSYVCGQVGKPVSGRALALELRKRGIDDAVARRAIQEAAIDEVANAKALLHKRLGRQSGTALSAKERAKQCRYLAGKGFDGSTIQKVMADYGTETDGACGDEYV